jgi:hypothetical protein
LPWLEFRFEDRKPCNQRIGLATQITRNCSPENKSDCLCFKVQLQYHRID